MQSREVYWNVMFLVLNEIYFKGSLKPTEIIHISTDEDLEYENNFIFMNVFTKLNICEMTGLLLSKMCMIKVNDVCETEMFDILQDELSRCGFTAFGNEEIVAKERFYKSEKEYIKIFRLHQKICNVLANTNFNT